MLTKNIYPQRYVGQKMQLRKCFLKETLYYGETILKTDVWKGFHHVSSLLKSV